MTRANLALPVEIEALAVAFNVCCDLGAVAQGVVLKGAQLLALGIEVLRLVRRDLAGALVEVQRPPARSRHANLHGIILITNHG